MADFEENIATYLTLDGHVFIAPQYQIAYDKEVEEGGACPDFVAIDTKLREIIVVEVTSSSNVKPLICRVKERRSRWYGPINRKLTEVGVLRDDWKPTRFLGFVRKANLSIAQASFENVPDVAFYAIEDAMFPWEYWDKRLSGGLPR